MTNLIPSAEEIGEWLHVTLYHVLHIEFYLQRLQVGSEDPERPHDIVGTGNKLTWPVMCGFAVQYRDLSRAFYDQHVEPSRRVHNCQYHHRMFNEPNVDATADGLKLGAVDALCSLLEPRRYQGGVHSIAQIEGVISKNPEHKRPWLGLLLTEMELVEQPKICIVSLREFGNPGIDASTFETIRQRFDETLLELRHEHSYVL
jgi:hypothetical protein